MKELQSPFNKANAYLSTPNHHTSDNSKLSSSNNKNLSKNDSDNSKQNTQMTDNQAKNKAQDTNVDNSQMNLSDPASQKKSMPEEDKSSFSLTDYFKNKAREKIMNQLSSSTQDTPDAAQQPTDNSPSPNKPKPAPKTALKPTNLTPPTPKTSMPKFASRSSIPNLKMPKLR